MMGKSGRLAILWNADIQVEVQTYSRRHISVWIVEENNRKWLLIGFYGQRDSSKRQESWKFLAALKPQDEIAWIVVGDFNDVVTNDEKKGKASTRTFNGKFLKRFGSGTPF